MKLGKIIGNVVATVKDPGLEGLRLLVVQGLDDDYRPNGNPFVAADGILTAGPGDIVYLVSKKEAAMAISKDKLIPIDECVVGFVDEYAIKGKVKTEKREKKRLPSDKAIRTKTPTSDKTIKTKIPTSDKTIKTKIPTSDKVIRTKKPS